MNNFAFNCYSRPRSWDYCQIFKTTGLFLLNEGLFSVFTLWDALRHLYLQVSAQRFEPWRFHRTEEVSNNFSVSWHITHISMAISANLGRDTDLNSTMLVCDHPLHGRGPYHPLWDRSIPPPPTGRVRTPPRFGMTCDEYFCWNQTVQEIPTL